MNQKTILMGLVLMLTACVPTVKQEGYVKKFDEDAGYISHHLWRMACRAWPKPEECDAAW